MERSETVKQTRRIQLSGGSTYIISLPKNWVDDFKIKVGDSITLIKNANKSLSLYPKEQTEFDDKIAATITTSQKDSVNSVKRKIIAVYLSGYKKIQIKSKGMKIPTEHSRGIRELVRTSMIGTEIVESNSENIIIQILTRLPELSFDTALKRMFLMATNMIKESIECLEETDNEHADEVVRMDDEVDRFSLYIRRNLALAIENQNILLDMGLSKPANCLGYRTIVSRIERIADHASLIAKRIKFIENTIEAKTVNKIKKLSEKSLEVFEESVTSVQKHDYSRAENTAEKVREIIEEEKKIMSGIKENSENSTIIRFVLEDIRRIVEYSSDIAEVAIDQNIGRIVN